MNWKIQTGEKNSTLEQKQTKEGGVRSWRKQNQSQQHSSVLQQTF